MATLNRARIMQKFLAIAVKSPPVILTNIAESVEHRTDFSLARVPLEVMTRVNMLSTSHACTNRRQPSRRFFALEPSST